MTKIHKNADGRWTPVGSEKAWDRYANRAKDMSLAVQMCPKRRIAVQAGGNIGAWPVWLSKRFQQVLTFEPEKVNYDCLIRNVEPYANIETYNAALSDRVGEAFLNVCRSIGSHHVSATGSQAVKLLTIDSFNLEALDYIVLDVEGFEWEALAGADETIRRFRPIIQVEDRGHGATKGQGKTFTDIINLLQGYQIQTRVGRDVIFTPKN